MSRRKRVLLYGANNKPVKMAGGWDASSHGSRATHWSPTSQGINSLLSGEISVLRDRSRDEFRRNPFAAAASRARVASLVGKGIRPKPNTENEELRIDILDAWNEWVDECDVDGTSDFYGLESLTARGAFEGGSPRPSTSIQAACMPTAIEPSTSQRKLSPTIRQRSGAAARLVATWR